MTFLSPAALVGLCINYPVVHEHALLFWLLFRGINEIVPYENNNRPGKLPRPEVERKTVSGTVQSSSDRLLRVRHPKSERHQTRDTPSVSMNAYFSILGYHISVPSLLT